MEALTWTGKMMAFSQVPARNMPAAAMSGQFADPAADQLPRLRRKRKADTHDANHERLNKRMSLLNLEHNGPRLCVPVEQSQLPPSTTTDNIPPTQPAVTIVEDEPMQLDDTKHKVYIYNLDDELSSDSESDTSSRLVILPDLAAHLRANRVPPLRIPRPIPPPAPADDRQVVLYQPDGPASLSVPAEQDGVRRAIVAARERVRERQAAERLGSGSGGGASVTESSSSAGRKSGTTISFATPVKFPAPLAMSDGEGEMVLDEFGGGQSSSSAAAGGGAGIENELNPGYYSEAMDID